MGENEKQSEGRDTPSIRVEPTESERITPRRAFAPSPPIRSDREHIIVKFFILAMSHDFPFRKQKHTQFIIGFMVFRGFFTKKTNKQRLLILCFVCRRKKNKTSVSRSSSLCHPPKNTHRTTKKEQSENCKYWKVIMLQLTYYCIS